MNEAGVAVLGGHTAYSEQPLLGVCAFGEAAASKPKRPMKKGDDIYLSKPLGSGIAISALREGACPKDLEISALSTMRSMNTLGLELAKHARIKLVSDVTGFGLAGQAILLARQTGLSVVLNGADLSALPHVRELARAGTGCMSAERNLGLVRANMDGGERVDRILTADPQTNGPLLVVAARDASKYLAEKGLVKVGHLESRQSALVRIR